MRSRQQKMSGVMDSRAKKVMHYIELRIHDVFKENIVLKTILKDYGEKKEMMKDIPQKITKRSVTADVSQDTEDLSKRDRVEDFSLILSVKDKNTDIDSIEAEIKDFCRADVNMPKPKGVVKAKAGQIIIRMRTKQ